ncbi:MAG: Spy/CpxP family protein refolding chaperone [Thiohalocapsa sp.]|uniref:Spy/CpxP family protein refolding chaperone n=1 Tax=Thiohalocapsa sp. TaxID=2497641 RepID=UPI0025D585DB|nr:Spy/CpxP family protein refolding chaperone [Thiohalocapsa sp.]MCG6942199.1 Spy/CpxP family protein refolding chaperone [Thiohalocapsa sp.]
MNSRQSATRLGALLTASALILGGSGTVLAAESQGTGAADNPAASSAAPSTTPSPAGGPWMMGGPGMMGPGMMGASVKDTEQWLADVKQQLGITASQEDAWKGYKQAVTNQSALMNAHHETMWNGQAIGGNEFAQMRQQGWQTMQQTGQAANTLYQSLTPEQQAKARGLLIFQRGPGWGR